MAYKTRSYGLILTVSDGHGRILTPIIANTRTQEKVMYFEDGKDHHGKSPNYETALRKKLNQKFGQGAFGILKSGTYLLRKHHPDPNVLDVQKVAHGTNTFGRIAHIFHLHTTLEAWEKSCGGAPGSPRYHLVSLDEITQSVVPCGVERGLIQSSLKSAQDMFPQLAESA